MKKRLLSLMDVRSGQRILDIGCGTGTLTVMAKKAFPQAIVTGLDVDPEILALARNKADEAGLEIRFDQSSSAELPYPDATFDHVMSSLMTHHLTTSEKIKTLNECYRVLKPRGQIHILDFGVPVGIPARLISVIMRRLEETADNIKGLLPSMLAEAGFSEIEKTADFMTIFGTMSLYKATRVK